MMTVSTLQAQTLAERVARCVGPRLLAWRPVTGGYSAARRLIVTCADGTSVFVKGATDARTNTWLRTEYSLYVQMQAPFLPTMHAWEDDGSSPFLVLEDLSRAVWQAPWTMARVMQVLDTLRQVAATPPPAGLGSLEERRASWSGWRRWRKTPPPFCDWAWARPPGWLTPFLPWSRQKPARHWRVRNWCTAMSGVIISVSSATGWCSVMASGHRHLQPWR